MIRSRSIPSVLSRATGDGIHAILLIDADGELLGSYGSPPHHSITDSGGNSTNNNLSLSSSPNPQQPPQLNNTQQQHWPPLDAASIGALISEVAGDYRRMGEELWLLDPSGHQSPTNKKGKEEGVGQDGTSGVGGGNGLNKGGDDDMGVGGEVGGSSSAVGGGGGEKSGSNQDSGLKDKGNIDSGLSGSNLRSLVIEMEYGVVGVASAGPDFYVIAIADSTVQHGALTGRLRALGSHVREALELV